MNYSQILLLNVLKTAKFTFLQHRLYLLVLLHKLLNQVGGVNITAFALQQDFEQLATAETKNGKRYELQAHTPSFPFQTYLLVDSTAKIS